MAWTVAVIAALTSTVSYIDRQTFSVLAPKVTAALHISEAGYGWLTSAFALAYLVATPVSGWWIDRIGARRGLVGSVLVWSSVAAMHALVPNFAVMLLFRIALGLAEGPTFPGASQTVQRVLPPKDRARGFGLLFTGSSIGAMLVPPMASRLYAWQGWRVAFIGTSLAGLLWLPAWLAVTRRRDVRAVIDRVPDATPRARPRIADLARTPAMVRALIAIFVAAPVALFVQIWGAKYLVRAFAIDQKHVGDFLWLPPLLFDAGALAFGDFASRWPSRTRALYACTMLLAVTIALVPLATTPWQAMVVMGIASLGGGGMYTICAADLLSRVAPDAVSFAGGTLAGAQSLALIVAGPIVGACVGHFQSYSQVTVALAPLAVIGSLIWIFWRVPTRALE